MIGALLTTYGAFVTMVLGLIAYFINRHYNFKNKKAELDYSFFQEHKIKVIVKFFDCYSNAERFWIQFPVYKALDHELTADNMDEMILPVMNPLRTTISELTLYMDPKETEPFNRINASLHELNSILMEMYFHPKTGEEKIRQGNRFHSEQRKAIMDCQGLLKQIGSDTRTSFIK